MSYELTQCVAPLPPVERGKSLVLSGDPKGKNFLYCSGNSVVIRDIENPAIADIYTEHSTKATVAKYAPSQGVWFFVLNIFHKSWKLGFSKISWVLERVLMEHIKLIYSLESENTFISVCSI